jgi:GH25 family lysozyme M1 (1,4-beta-N-acetylmuramidase)
MHRFSRALPVRAVRAMPASATRGRWPLRALRARVLTPTRALALLLALSILPAVAGTVDASSTRYVSNCGTNLRSRPTTSSTIRKVITVDTVVTVVGKVAGGYWSASCRTWVKGSYWYKISAINGKSVSSLTGAAYLYAATGLFRAATSGYSEGVDVSNWQGWINFTKVKAAGKKFVVAKASEGNTWTDPSYARNKSNAMAAGLKFTGYHFARPNSTYGDAAKEADHFVAVLGLRHGMLVPALDLEVSGGLGVTALQSWVKSFLARVHYRTGAKPMIYTNPSFWSSAMGNTTWFAANGYRVLWTANWKVTSPAVPASNWSGASWTFWQYSSCGSVAGISGCVDLDRFKGSDFSGVTF